MWLWEGKEFIGGMPTAKAVSMPRSFIPACFLREFTFTNGCPIRTFGHDRRGLSPLQDKFLFLISGGGLLQ